MSRRYKINHPWTGSISCSFIVLGGECQCGANDLFTLSSGNRLIFDFFLFPQHEYDFTKFSYNYYENELLVETYFVDGVRAFKEVVSTWDGFESYLPKIDYLIKNICEIGKRSFVRNEPGSGYNVLNHGDFHLRNILMKLDTNSRRLESFRLV